MSPILMLVADTSGTFTATVVIAGISIVIGVLLLLIYVFQAFGAIAPKIEKRTKAREEKRAAKKAAKTAAKLAMKKGEKADAAADSGVPAKAVPIPSPSPAPVVEQGISGEVVAAITAAIVASEGTGVTVRSIKKKKVSGRNPWAQAASIDNTRPF